MVNNNIAEAESHLQGAWNLVAMTTQFGDDAPVPNPGTTGTLVYNTHPCVQSVQAMIDKPSRDKDSETLSFAYSGKYEILEYDPKTRTGRIVHHIEQERTTVKNKDGSDKEQGRLAKTYDMVREFQISTDGQTLTITGEGKRKESVISIIWQGVIQPANGGVAPSEELALSP